MPAPSVPDEPVTGRASVRGAVPPPVRASARVGVPPVETPPESGGDRPAPTAKAKRRRRRNIIIASLAAFIMLTGVGMVAGTYYFDQVALPENLAMEQSTTIYYADGVTPMGRIGD